MSTTEYRTGGIRKHSSTDEYNYFRGVAADVYKRQVKDIDPNAFISQSSVIGVYGEGFDRLKVK